MALLIPMPTWDPYNLRKHYQKRINQDPGCFEDLMNINGRSMTIQEYQQRSEQAVMNAWAKYQCETWDQQLRRYQDRRTYFVDDQLVVAITDIEEQWFITCFHKHFNSGHTSPGSTVGQCRLRYKEHLSIDERVKLVRNVKRIRGWPELT